MAISLGLSRKEFREYRALLKSPHWIHVRIQVLNLSHEYIGDISDRLLSGQVNIDADAEVTRSLEMDLFDPTSALRITPDDPDDGAMFMDRMLKVWYCVAPPDKSKWFEVPVFTGPITKVDREDVVLKVEAQGKEVLSLASRWKNKTYKKGLKKTTVIYRILVRLSGEKKVSIPDDDERLPRHLSIGMDKSSWEMARHLAGTIDRQAFYDGRGVAVVRRRPTKTIAVFDEDNMLSKPQISYDTNEAKNAVLVIGAKPKGAKKRIRVRKVAPKSHVLSPWKIGRKNKEGKYVPRYLPMVIEDDSIRSKKKARRIAKRRLRGLLIEAIDGTFTALPVPDLEPLDVFRCETAEFSSEMRLRKMTIPLTADGVSSIGVLERTTPRRRQFRVRRR